MKEAVKFLLLGTLFIVFLSACDKLKIKKTINCAPVGEMDNHPNGATYQNILESYLGTSFPGFTAAIYTPSTGLWVGAAGLANVQDHVGMNTCHALFSGSVAKMYTNVCALHLYETGQLNLDAPIADFLPQEIVDNFPNANLATVKQLMNHSAGMPDHDESVELNAYIESNNGNLPSPLDQMRYMYDVSPRFTPGDSTAYSSAHTVLLAMIIDDVTETSHADVFTAQIVNKLGLTETYYKNEIGYPSPPNMVNGYIDDPKKKNDYTQESINYCNGSWGDAGVIATANDYFLFMKGLMEHNLLLPATVDLMKEDFEFFNVGAFALGYGLGLFVIEENGVEVKIGHSGSTAGGMSHVYYYPTTQSYIVLLTNTLHESDSQKLLEWGAEVLVGTPTTSIMSELEDIVLQ